MNMWEKSKDSLFVEILGMNGVYEGYIWEHKEKQKIRKIYTI